MSTVLTTPQPTPLIHVPLYCWHKAPDYAMRAMVEQHLACLESYFAHENTYDVLVTTNDRRPFEIFSAYKDKMRHPVATRRFDGQRFEVRFVTRHDLLSTFKTDRSRLDNTPCIRTIFSKFYPILKREADAIVHVDFDTMFAAKIELAPLLTSDIGLVDANQFLGEDMRWRPTEKQAEFFRLPPSATSRWNWINSGVFTVQRSGFQIIEDAVAHYLENLERAIVDRINTQTDEIIMNALAVREPDAVNVTADYRYNFLAYFLKHDPEWTTRAQIIHFHSLKPDKFWYVDGALQHRCDDVFQASRVSEDLYLAVLMWFRHFHAACDDLPYLFPLLKAIPPEVVETELSRRLNRRASA